MNTSLVRPCQQTSSKAALRRAVRAVHGDAAEELRIEVGGLLRENFASGGDLHDLIDGAGIQEKRDLRSARVHGIESGAGIAFVSEMGFGGDGLRSNAESRLKNTFVEEDDVEFALQRGDIGEELSKNRAVAKCQDVIRAFSRICGRVDPDGASRSSAGEAGEKFLARFLFLVVRNRKRFCGEPGLEMAAHDGPAEIVDISGDSMRGQNR